jgi:4-hydroxybenzoyl-CoA reductase subunit beta
MTLGAVADLVSADGTRTLPVEQFFVADGIWNTVRRRDELVVRVRIPLPASGVRMAYRKVRQRGSIDFPLLSIALAADLEPDDTVRSMSLVVSALGSRPRVVAGLEKVAAGARLHDVVEAVAEQAFKQCHPLENIIVDPDWRRAMVPVYVRRALEEIGGPSRRPADTCRWAVAQARSYRACACLATEVAATGGEVRLRGLQVEPGEGGRDPRRGRR